MRRASRFGRTACTRCSMTPCGAGLRGEGDRRPVALRGVVGSEEFADEGFPGNPEQQRPARRTEPVQRTQQRQIVIEGFAKTDARIETQRLGIDAGGDQRLPAARRKTRAPRPPHPRSAARCCMVRGSPCMCITTTPQALAAQTPGIAGSARSPLTSLTMSAPAASAAAATGGLRGVDGDQPVPLGPQRGHHRNGAGDFLGRGNRRRARPGRFAADIDDARALGDHPAGMVERGGGVGMAAAVRKRVRA